MTGLLGAPAAIFAAEPLDYMQRLYQWLARRASFFRYDAVGQSASRTVRTETTVRREELNLPGSAAALASIPVRFAAASWHWSGRNRRGILFRSSRSCGKMNDQRAVPTEML